MLQSLSLLLFWTALIEYFNGSRVSWITSAPSSEYEQTTVIALNIIQRWWSFKTHFTYALRNDNNMHNTVHHSWKT
jgi:hypothetical protein